MHGLVNKPETVNSYFAAGAAIWRTRRNSDERVSGQVAPLCENITSSTKPEVHNMLQCRKKGTEPQTQVTRAENLMKFVYVVFEICERTQRQKQTNKHAYTLITIPCQPTGSEVKVEKFSSTIVCMFVCPGSPSLCSCQYSLE